MALPTSIELQIVTPDGLLVKEQVDEVEIPWTEGYFGVLPGHTPMLASLAVGELRYRKGQEKTYLSVASVSARCCPTRSTILAQLAERAEDIDSRARKRPAARRRAPRRASRTSTTTRARRRSSKSLARLQVASRRRWPAAWVAADAAPRLGSR